MDLLKKKYIVWILGKEQDSYEVLAKVKITSDTEVLTYKKNPIPIDISKKTFSKGLTSYFLLDTSSNKQLSFKTDKKTAKAHKKVIDDILNGHIVMDLTTDMNPSFFKTNLIMVIFTTLFGGLVGFIVGGYV